jgi:Ca2+-binding EF-hand superfamily protein
MSDYAKSLVKKYDKNGDGMLQADEQKDLHGPAAGADLNHDGVITVEELVTHLTSPSPSSASTSSSGLSSSSSGSSPSEGGHWGRHHHDSDSNSNNGDKPKTDTEKALAGRVFTGTAGGMASLTKEGDKRHSYRFSSPSDRKPGLPGELKSRDANGDGQVSMSEFSRYWSSSVVADFRRWDLNNDGVITAKEAAQKK